MKTRMLLGALPLVFIGSQALAEGDVAAGKAKYDAECEECHYDDDFSGETAADVAAWIQGCDRILKYHLQLGPDGLPLPASTLGKIHSRKDNFAFRRYLQADN